MSFQEKVFFIPEALVPGLGWSEANVVFIREEDGRYRIASGEDIAWIHDKAPNFFRQTLDKGWCQECGAKLISGR